MTTPEITIRTNHDSRSGGFGTREKIKTPENPPPTHFVPRIIKSDIKGLHIQQQETPPENSSKP